MRGGSCRAGACSKSRHYNGRGQNWTFTLKLHWPKYQESDTNLLVAQRLLLFLALLGTRRQRAAKPSHWLEWTPVTFHVACAMMTACAGQLGANRFLWRTEGHGRGSEMNEPGDTSARFHPSCNQSIAALRACGRLSKLCAAASLQRLRAETSSVHFMTRTTGDQAAWRLSPSVPCSKQWSHTSTGEPNLLKTSYCTRIRV